MNTTILQVPVDKALRKQADSVAADLGFSSLQEVVRVFLRKLARRRIDVEFEETIQLSPKAIKRYNKILKEIEQNKNIYTAKNVDDLMRQLHGN